MQKKEGKKKNIALKAQEEKVVDETKINNMEDDIALIKKRVQKLMMKNKFGGKTYNKRSNYKKEGPLKEVKETREGAKEVIKANREKRRAMKATWSQSEDSSDDENENEVANMCFMAFEDKDEVNSNLDEDEKFMFEYDDLLKAIYKLDEKNTLLKKKVFELKKELDEIKEKFSKIEATEIFLEKENDKTRPGYPSRVPRVVPSSGVPLYNDRPPS